MPLAVTPITNREERVLIMKRSIVFLLVSIPGLAAQQTWTGQISDSMCGVNHAAMGDMGKNPTECTKGCVKAGSKYVLASGGKVFEISNQNFGGFAKAAGQKVNLTGDLGGDGKTITVSKVVITK